jgi:hypothetical protein
MARPRLGPGKPGPARVCAPSPDRSLPRHVCATALPCASTAPSPRRRVRVAARPLRPFPEHPSGATRTHPWLLRTHAHTLAHCTGSSQCRTKSHRGRRVGPSCQRKEKEQRQPSPTRRRRRKEEAINSPRPKKRSKAKTSQSAHLPEPTCRAAGQADPRAEPSPVGPIEPAQLKFSPQPGRTFSFFFPA